MGVAYLGPSLVRVHFLVFFLINFLLEAMLNALKRVRYMFFCHKLKWRVTYKVLLGLGFKSEAPKVELGALRDPEIVRAKVAVCVSKEVIEVVGHG